MKTTTTTVTVEIEHCQHSGPVSTECMTIQVKDAKAGDWLDTRGSKDYRDPGLHELFTDATLESGRPGSCGVYALNRTATYQIREVGSRSIIVWRPIASLAPENVRPLDRRTDRPFRNLTEVHRAGLAGLAKVFTPGSYWEVGPFVDGRDPEVVRVLRGPRTGGTNYSSAPEDAEARGKQTWFIPVESIWSPHGPRVGGAQPPAVLCPLTERMAVRAGLRDVTDERTRYLEREVERLNLMLRRSKSRVTDLTIEVDTERNKRKTVQARLDTLRAQVNTALVDSRI